MVYTFEQITKEYYINNNDYEIKDQIVSFYNTQIIDSNYINNSYYLLWIGNYYQYTEINYDQMKKYYKMAIDQGNHDVMFNLGLYYNDIETNYDQMKKYYKMAIDQGNHDAMFNLGLYYDDIETNYDLMIKYYLEAIDQGNKDAITTLNDYLNNNLNKLYDNFELYYPYLNIINIPDLHKNVIKKIYLENQNNKINLLPLHEDIKNLLLKF